MGIDDKPTAAWTEADLQEVCDARRREQPRLEFKQELSLDRDGQKNEVERDVQGMASAGGGHIIYGIVEDNAGDGSKVASRLLPLADAGLYERLNNLLDSRGDPRLPFEIYAIDAEAGGIYIVVEVHGHRRPHLASDGRYYIRRNLLVRRMTEAEVSEAYRQRFEREREVVPRREERAPEEDATARVRHGLDGLELASYRQETGDDRQPGWLSVWTQPAQLRPNMLDPRRFEGHEFANLHVEGLWREHPLQYINPRKTLRGFEGQLPPEGGYPHYFARLWSDGLLEYGDLQAPVVREADPERNRLIATHAVAEYVHDFLLFAQAVFAHVGYDQDVMARARFDNVEGYRLAVNPRYHLRGDLVVRENVVESEQYRGPVHTLDAAAVEVAHDLSDRIFIAGGQQGAYFFDNDGSYTGGRN